MPRVCADRRRARRPFPASAASSPPHRGRRRRRGVSVGPDYSAGVSADRPPIRVVLLAVSDSLAGNGLFFDPRPWLVVLAAVAVLAFIWAVKRGQFDDLDTPAVRILHDDEEERS